MQAFADSQHPHTCGLQAAPLALLTLDLAWVGAAVINGFGTDFTFTDCNFAQNHGRQTGAITVTDGSIVLNNVTFDSNQGEALLPLLPSA